MLFLFSIVLAAAETAFTRMSRIRALSLEEEGRKGAHRLAVMLEHPETPLHWRHLATALGRADVRPRHTIRFGYYTMVIRAALSGQGMALVPRGLIADDLQSGRLVNPGGIRYRSGFCYWFTVPSPNSVSPALQTFVDWLKAASCEMPADDA